MKMIIAIIDDSNRDRVAQSLISQGFGVTQLAASGGLFRGGATTFMIGVEDQEVERALSLIRDQVKVDPQKVQATLYVLNLRDFDRI